MPRSITQPAAPGGLRAHLALTTAMAALVVIAHGGGTAEAGTCSPLNGADITCQGPADAGSDVTQTLTGGGGPVSVTTTDGFGIDTSDNEGDALTITGEGGLSFSDEVGAAITGKQDGIDASNTDGGALSITTSGTVTGVDGNAISAENDKSGTTLTISSAGASGGQRGISAVNLGSGDLTIVTTGAVSGGSYEGIRAGNSYGGAISITAAETVTSDQFIGISIGNSPDGTDLTVSAAGVSGYSYGILATNSGTGDMAITTTGAVTATVFDAINALTTGGGAMSITAKETATSDQGNGITGQVYFGTSLSISAAGVSGGATGILAVNKGTGDLSITTSGAVTAGTGHGIDASNTRGGSLNIAATETVSSAGGNAISASNDASGLNTTITVTDAISSGGNGIQADHRGSGDLSITVSGTVRGTIGIVNTDSDALGGLIKLTQDASVETTAQNAIVDGDGATFLVSRGAILGSVLMNGGDDTVDLVDGAATMVIDLGDDDDQISIFGANGGGGWDDADFSGGFDNNGDDLPLDMVGGEGTDSVSLFGVTAAAQALGTGTGFEQISLLDHTLIELNGADLSSFGTVTVDGTSTLKSEGNSPSESTVGSVSSAGVIDLADGAANDGLTVAGDYAGAPGSRLLIDFDGSTGTADRFIIMGDVGDVSVGDTTAGHTVTTIHIAGGEPVGSGLTGRELRGFLDDIRLIEVSGAAEADDFVLGGPVEFGIFDHALVFEDGAFLLRPDFFDQIYTYENLPGAMQTIGLALTGQLVERVGVRSAVPGMLADAAGTPVPGGAPVDTAIWGRAVGLSLDSEGDLDSVTGSSFQQTIGFLQAGVDVTVLRRPGGRLLVGALGHWGTSSLDVLDFDGDDAGGASFDFYGGGLTATWYATAGWYFDNVFQYTAYDIDISGGARFGATSTDGYGIALSHELGYRVPIGATAALVPQAQITYQHVDFDDFTDPDGVRVSLDDGDSLFGRLGVAFENAAAIGSALATGYVEANLSHEFLGDNSVGLGTGLGGVAVSQDLGGTSVELGFGGTVAVARGVSLYAEVDYTIPFDSGVQGVQALGGIRVNLNPPPPPPPPVPTIQVHGDGFPIVFFDWDSAALSPQANLVLDDVVVIVNETGYAAIRLDGYTDLSGSAAYNLGLSERRANAVADGLIARGIAPDEIVIRAFGEENPLVPTPDGVREPQNRRVEIFLN